MVRDSLYYDTEVSIAYYAVDISYIGVKVMRLLHAFAVLLCRFPSFNILILKTFRGLLPYTIL